MAANGQCDQGITGFRHARAQPSPLGAEDKDLAAGVVEVVVRLARGVGAVDPGLLILGGLDLRPRPRGFR